MSEKSKGVVQAVLEKKKKDGSPYWAIIIDGVDYYDSRGNFKDKKDQEVEFEWSASQDGNLKFINPVGGGWRGGGARGKSPEELVLQKKSFAMAYAKDLTCVVISSSMHLMKELPEGVKYLEFVGLMREASANMTEKTMEKFIGLLG